MSEIERILREQNEAARRAAELIREEIRRGDALAATLRRLLNNQESVA